MPKLEYSGFRLIGTHWVYDTLSQLSSCPSYAKFYVKSYKHIKQVTNYCLLSNKHTSVNSGTDGTIQR